MDIDRIPGIMKKEFSIWNLKAREILDCRGEPTLEVDVITKSGLIGRADVPARAKKYSKYALNTADEGGYTPPMTEILERPSTLSWQPSRI